MKLEDLKKIGIKNFVLILIAGIMLLLCAIPGRTKENNAKENTLSAVVTPMPTEIPSYESRMETLLSQVEGIGKTKVMIVSQNSDDIEGIVIVAEGAGKADVLQYISDAAEALFGIPKHKIIVLPMKTDNGS